MIVNTRNDPVTVSVCHTWTTPLRPDKPIDSCGAQPGGTLSVRREDKDRFSISEKDTVGVVQVTRLTRSDLLILRDLLTRVLTDTETP